MLCMIGLDRLDGGVSAEPAGVVKASRREVDSTMSGYYKKETWSPNPGSLGDKNGHAEADVAITT